MSWFSRTLSGSPPGQDRGRKDQDAEMTEVDEEANISSSSPTAKGVKEDLSELRKTFTRQLWGVASFLAPPAAEKSDEPAGKFGELPDDEPPSDILKDVQTRPSGSSGLPSEATFSSLYKASLPEYTALEAASSTDDHSFPVTAGAGPDDSMAARQKSGARGFGEQLWGPDHGLLGLRSDFAELTGSLSTGLSKFSSSVIRAVAGEDFEDQFKALSPGSPRSQSADSDHSAKNTGLNSLLKPLFDNILTREKSGSDSGKDTEFEPWGTEDDQAETLEDFRDGSKASTQDSFPTAIVTGINEISKLASSFLPFSLDSYSKGSESSEDRLLAIGVTSEVIAFASNIAMHPETWLDFPLASDDEADEFQLSIEQEEHVHALELAAPSLAALRIEMCPEYMSEGRFWKIYFVLLQSRLNKEDSELLCTPQIIEARKHLLDEVLRREDKTEDLPSEDEHGEMGRVHGWLEDNSKVVQDRSVVAPETSAAALQKAPDSASNITGDETKISAVLGDHITDQSGITASPRVGSQQSQVLSQLKLADDEGDAEEWLDEDPLSNEAGLGAHAGPEEDVSFSDLEDDDTNVSFPARQAKYLKPLEDPERRVGQSPELPVGHAADAAKPEKLESDDWLTVNEEDIASADSS